MGDILYRNVHPLYAVMAFMGALIVLIMLVAGILNRKGIRKNHKRIFCWVIFFCIQDGIWGLFASHSLHNDFCLLVTSYVFHLSAIISAFVWTLYFLSRLKDRTANFKLYIIFSAIVALVQLGMLATNISSQFMFYVDGNGWYQTTDYRSILFYLQFATYIFIGVVTIIGTAKEEHREKRIRLTTIFLVNLSPLFFGIFQLIYPDAPADSIGFAIGCVIIEMFLSRDSDEQVYTLEQMQVQLNAALNDAEAANKAKTSFLFNMSHDIRTPMNAILGYTDIALKHQEDQGRVKDSLAKIKTAGEHLLNLINDILEMSRIESGKHEIAENPMDIRKLINGAEQMSIPMAMSKSIDFQVKIGEIRNPYVYFDMLHANEVLINLISNAVKYTPDGGKVRLLAEQTSDAADGRAKYRFEVTDNGIGMSEEFQKHLFEAFSREKTSTVSKQEGAGLGLSIVKRIIDLAKGTISVKSKLNEGSTFIIELSLRVMDDEAVKAYEAENMPLDIDSNRFSFEKKKVLLVEDYKMNREIAIEILSDVGILTDTAEDGEIALKTILEKGTGYYDFVLMDIQMPVMDGYEATKAIRALPGGDQMTIIALSANAYEEDVKKSLEYGMNAHVSKPIDAKVLFETMQGLMKQKPDLDK